MCAWLEPMNTFVYFACVTLMQTVQKWSNSKLLNCKHIIIKKKKNLVSIDFSETISGREKKRGGNVWIRVTCVERHTVSSASTGLVKNQQDNSQRLSSKITVMAVCLTSTVTSPFCPPPSTSSPVIKVGKLNTPNVLCFHLVVTVTPKHGAAVNEIPVCHQSLADKDRIVVVFEWRGGNVLAEVEAGGLCAVWTSRPWAETWMFTLLSWPWHGFRFSAVRQRETERLSPHC